MTSSDRTILSTAIAACAGVPLVLGFALGWPIWLLLALPLLIIPVAIRAKIKERLIWEQDLEARMAARRASEPIVEPPQPEPRRFEETMVMPTELASSWSDYRFVFAAKVWWRPRLGANVPLHANMGAVAIDRVVDRAKEATVRVSPYEVTEIRHRLNNLLGQVVTDKSGMIEISAGEVQLDLDPADRERLEMFARTRKDAAVWEYERRREQDKRRYLGEDVLSDTGSAVVWWLVRQQHDVKNVVADIETLARLTAAANNVPGSTLLGGHMSGDGDRDSGYVRFPVVDGEIVDPAVERAEATPRATPGDFVQMMMEEVGLSPDAAEGELFVERLAQSFQAAGQTEAAADLRARFNTLDPTIDDDVAASSSAEGDVPSAVSAPAIADAEAGLFEPPGDPDSTQGSDDGDVSASAFRSE
ncbi:hypothetical protein [Amycolatopsis saalfeldensis]|uniref:Uncharacterized protein n=1 Tax=Amycolatopsis saalfeldensis TaxID=394193 RepID=A0A1H8YMW6_9PSEU|nr:hypothetical protein [Amycolatopsis saalfeldensis]SEP53496.1 hypothetical protein SAMN04489732_12792 [Amycolatopsis saalfeldensis]